MIARLLRSFGTIKDGIPSNGGIIEREDNNDDREGKVNSLRSAENAAQSTFIRC